MVYPATALPIELELAPGAAAGGDSGSWVWQDVTSLVRLADGVTIGRGRPNEGVRADPSTAEFTGDNQAGHWSWRNPFGQWSGRIGQNTPFRVRIRRVQDAFGRTVSNGWGTADSGQAWTTSGGVAGDYSVSASAGRHSVGAVNSARATVAGCALLDVEAVTTIVVGVTPTGAAITAGLAARWVDASNHYVAELLVNTTSQVDIRLRKVIAGVSTTLATATNVLTHTTIKQMRVRLSVVGSSLAAKVWDASGTEAVGWHVTATDTALVDTAGGVACRSLLAAGNTNALPVVVTYASCAVSVDRFCGFLTNSAPRWDMSGRDAYAPLKAAGMFRTIQSRKKPLRSPLFRSMAGVALNDYVPHAYWPMEDGADATQFASGLPSGAPMTFTGSVSPAADDTLPGSAALPEFAVGATARFTVPTYTDTGEWVVQFMAKMTATSANLLEITADGTAKRIVVGWNFGTQEFSVTMTNNAGGTVYSQVWSFVAADVTGRFLSISFGMSTNSGGTDQYNMIYQILGDPVQYGAGDPVPGAKGRITGGQLLASTTATTVAGHLGVFVDPNFSQGIDSYYNAQAMGGWAGETAGNRVKRLLREAGLRYIDSGYEADTAIMGVQQLAPLWDLLGHAEDADQGVLYENGFGVSYLPRVRLYSRPVALALDVAAGHIAQPPEPTGDDQRYVNEWTVKRIGGSFAVAADEDEIDAAGKVEASIDVNLGLDDDCFQHAAWRLARSTIAEDRWPHLALDMAASPELIDAWLSARQSARVTVANPPTQAPSTVDVLAEGSTEELGYKDWDIGLNLTPSAPFAIAAWDSTTTRYGASSTYLAEDLDLTKTGVNVTAGEVWVTTASHPTRFPFGVVIGELTYACTAISNAADDNFNGRTVASGWGTSSGGQVWTTSGGSAGDYAVAGGFGEITSNTVNTLRYVTMPVVSAQIDAMVNIRWPSLGAASGSALTGRLLWGSDLSNHYEATVSLTTAGTLTLTLSKRVAGIGSTLVAATTVDTYAANQVGWIRLRVLPGGSIQAWAWNSSATGVMASVVAADTDITDGQIIAVGCRRETGNTDAAALVRWDTLTVSQPYRLTITRLPTDKTHAAGTPVTVADTARYGL